MNEQNEALKNEGITLDDNEQVIESDDEQVVDSLDGGDIDDQDDIEAIKEENERLKKERDNYKKATLKYKKKSKVVTDDSDVEQAAEKAVKKTLYKQNERQAINEFLEKNPEFKDSELKKDLFANYTNKHGQDSVDDIIMDLERASVITKFDRGYEIKKIDNTKSDLSNLQSVSTTFSRKSRLNNNPEISERTMQMAKKMRVDPKKLEELGDNVGPYSIEI